MSKVLKNDKLIKRGTDELKVESLKVYKGKRQYNNYELEITDYDKKVP